MLDDTGPTIGETIARLRRGRITQTDLAAAADVSVDVIRKLEQGQRHTASIPTLQKLARVLDVDIGELLGKPKAMPELGPDAGIVAIRAALSSVDDLLDDEDDGPQPLTLDEARRTVSFAWAAYWAGRYDTLGKLLPVTIGQARATLRSAAADQQAEVSGLAARLYQVAAYMCVQVGWSDIAHLALREAMTTAERGADPRLPLALRRSMAWVLLTEGRYPKAHRLAASTATRVEPTTNDDLAGWTVYGKLLVTSATALARNGDGDSAAELLRDAGRVARRTGYRNDYECAFGPERVGMQWVDINIVSENFGAALAAADKMSSLPSLPLISRCRYRSDIALAQCRMGHDRAALDTLLAIEHAAPTWIRLQGPPRQVVRELWERAAPRDLTALAARMGVTRS